MRGASNTGANIPDEMTSAGKRIAGARRRAKLTGAELAARAGVTASWVRSVETGRTAQPAPDKLARVADVVGLDVRELLALTDQLGAATAPPAPAATPDLSALIVALQAQAEALSAMLAEMRDLSVLQRQMIVDLGRTDRERLESHGFRVLPADTAPDEPAQDPPERVAPPTSGRVVR